jgi:hypothetical protein
MPVDIEKDKAPDKVEFKDKGDFKRGDFSKEKTDKDGIPSRPKLIDKKDKE